MTGRFSMDSTMRPLESAFFFLSLTARRRRSPYMFTPRQKASKSSQDDTCHYSHLYSTNEPIIELHKRELHSWHAYIVQAERSAIKTSTIAGAALYQSARKYFLK